TRSATPPTPTPAPSIGQWSGPDGTMVFVDGAIYLFHEGASDAVGIIPDERALQPPVSTPHGVVVLGVQAGHETHLWLIPPGGGRAKQLATGVDGFAVSADGSRIAYSTPDVDPGISTLTEGPLARIENVNTESTVDTSVRVIGFAGSDVVMDSGDGAA